MRRLIGFAAAFLAVGFALPSAARDLPQAAVDGAKEAAVRRLLEAVQYENSIVQMTTQMRSMLPQQIAATTRTAIQGSKLSEAEKQEALSRLEGELSSRSARIFDQMLGKEFLDEATLTAIDIYGRHFTTEELNQLADFYATPVGRKVVTKLPVIMQESMQATMNAVNKRVPAIMAEMQKSLQVRTQ